MQLSLQDFTALVRIQAAAVGSSARTLIDLSVGSVLRAVLEANASVALWMQWLIMEVLSTTRAATSAGLDLDSWVGDFGLARLPAVAANGQVRFSRNTAGLEAVVPVGAVVRTGVGPDAQAYQVVANPQQAFWTGNGYLLDGAALEVIVPIQALVPGRAGSVQAAAIQLLSTAVPGVDAVVNDYPTLGGLDAESDPALRARFGWYVDSRTRATEQAVIFAILSVQQGLRFTIAERVDSGGSIRAGHFTVVVDDGSGVPSDALIAQVAAAIEAVRPLGGTFGVIKPSLVQASIVLRLAGTPNVAAVQAAVGVYVAELPIGGWLAISKIVQVVHEADAGVASVSGVTLNGSAGDLAPPLFGRIMPGTVTVQT